MNDLYVYVYLDPRKQGRWETSIATFLYEPIYVGEGCKGRAFDHLYDVSNTRKANKIRKILTDYKITKREYRKFIIKVATGLQGNESVQLETKLIRELGTVSVLDTVKRGPLTNVKLHDGTKHIVSDETKALLKIRAKEAAHKISASWKNNYEQRCSNISASYNRSPEASANRSLGQRGKVVSAETKNKQSISTKGKPKSIEHSKKIGNALRGKPKSALHRNNLAKTKRKIWEVNGFQIQDLAEWCKAQKISYEALKSAYRRGKPYKGFMLAAFVGA